jgi:hypothetical protein
MVKKTSVTSEAKKKTAAKKKPAAVKKQKTVKKKKTAASSKKPLTLKKILNLKFESWKPKTLYTPQPDEGYLEGFSAPPVIDESQKDEAERLRGIIFRKIDLPEFSAKEEFAPEPEAQAEPEKPEPLKTAPIPKEPINEEPTPPENDVAAPCLPEPEALPEQQTEASPVPAAFSETLMEAPKDANTGLKALVFSLAALFALLLIASAMNANRYTLKPTKSSLEIWKGAFSPTGMKRMLILPGAAAPERIKARYSKKEALTIPLRYYLQKTDDLLSASTPPDFKAVAATLDKAAALDLDRSQRRLVKEKIREIKALQSTAE